MRTIQEDLKLADFTTIPSNDNKIATFEKTPEFAMPVQDQNDKQGKKSTKEKKTKTQQNDDIIGGSGLVHDVEVRPAEEGFFSFFSCHPGKTCSVSEESEKKRIKKEKKAKKEHKDKRVEKKGNKA